MFRTTASMTAGNICPAFETFQTNPHHASATNDAGITVARTRPASIPAICRQYLHRRDNPGLLRPRPHPGDTGQNSLPHINFTPASAASGLGKARCGSRQIWQGQSKLAGLAASSKSGLIPMRATHFRHDRQRIAVGRHAPDPCVEAFSTPVLGTWPGSGRQPEHGRQPARGLPASNSN